MLSRVWPIQVFRQLCFFFSALLFLLFRVYVYFLVIKRQCNGIYWVQNTAMCTALFQSFASYLILATFTASMCLCTVTTQANFLFLWNECVCVCVPYAVWSIHTIEPRPSLSMPNNKIVRELKTSNWTTHLLWKSYILTCATTCVTFFALFHHCDVELLLKTS